MGAIQLGPWSIKGEVGVAEILAGATIVAAVLAALYNVGFFIRVDPSFISLLTLEDILVGGLLAAGVGLIAFLLMAAAILGTAIHKSSGSPLVWFLLISVIIAMLVVTFVVRHSLFLPLVIVTVSILVGTLMASVILPRKWQPRHYLSVISIMLAIPLFLGFSMAKADDLRSEVHLKDGTSISGTLIRTTTSYLFLEMPDGSYAAISTDEVRWTSTRRMAKNG